MGFHRRRRRTRRGEPVDQPHPPPDDTPPDDTPPDDTPPDDTPADPSPEQDPAGTSRPRRAPSPADFAGVQTTPIADPPPNPAPHAASHPQPAPGPRPVPPHGPGSSHGAGSSHGSDHAYAAGDAADVESERGLRGLVGSGSSQVSLTAAMRARDAARPDDAELAATAAELTIVRRNWTPRDDSRGRALPPGTR